MTGSGQKEGGESADRERDCSWGAQPGKHGSSVVMAPEDPRSLSAALDSREIEKPPTRESRIMAPTPTEGGGSMTSSAARAAHRAKSGPPPAAGPARRGAGPGAG